MARTFFNVNYMLFLRRIKSQAKMRYYGILTAMLLLPFIWSSCTKPSAEPEVVSAAISTDRQSIAAGSSGLETQLQLRASHDWTVKSDSWITVTPSSGAGYSGYQFLTVKVAANDDVNSRVGNIEFSLTGQSKSVSVAVSQDGAVATISIAEFKKKKVNTSDWYTLRGVITSIESKSYGDFYVKDDTDEILVYGMTAKKNSMNDKSFSSLNLQEGDVLTFCSLRSDYNGEAQAGGNTAPAYYIVHEKGKAPDPVYKDYTAKSATATWMELPATSDDDGLIFIHHGMKIGSVPFRDYSAYYDKETFVSNWVAYPLDRKSIGYGARTDAWALDPLLDEDIQPYIINISYKKGNEEDYVRGHQIPSGDRLGYEANTKTFYGINMTPQNPVFNGGVWVTLEDKIRSWAKKSDTDSMYVVTGCVTKGSEIFVYDERGHKVTVPVGYYKTVLRLADGEYSANAFYFEHKPNSDTDLKKYAISVDALEEKTGVDFFVNLPAVVGEAKANAIEAANPTSESFWWN